MEILSVDDINAHIDEKDYSIKQFVFVGVIKQTMEKIINNEVKRCGEANAYHCWQLFKKELNGDEKDNDLQEM